jgi:tetratricopeptide (TPR) repeat protein
MFDRRNEIAAGWRSYLADLARDRPVVVWIDDVHWAEAETIHILDRATFQSATPIMVLATARADFPGITAIRPGEDRMFVELAPLSMDDAATLAETVGARQLERTLRAAGNPLFIVELSRSRAEVEDDVPLTLQAAIAARLDELAPVERDVLQCASIVGDTFSMREAALLSDRLPAEVAGVLGRLTHLRHVEPVDGAFRFHHVLVRDAAYGRLPTSARMKLHARFAREGLDPDDVEALAHHWWEALRPPDAEWVWEDQSERETMRVEALRAHLAAGERLAERLAVERMVVVFERALQFTSGAIEAAKTEEAFGLGYHRNAKGDEAIVHRLRAIELYKSSGREAPARLYADTLDIPVYNWGYFHKQPDVDSTLRLIDDGIAVARRADEPRTLMRLLVQRGLFANDNTVIDEIDRLLRITATERDQADVLWRLALMTAVAMHDVKRARAALDVAFELANQGARFNEAEARLWGCTVLFHAGDLAGAEKHADRLDTISRTQSPHSRQHAFGAKGIIELARGNWQGLADLARDLRELVAANPDGSFCIMGANLAAHGAMADLVLGRVLPEDLVALEERLLPEASSTRAAAVLPAMAMAGRPGDDEEAARSYDFGRRIADRQAVFDLGAMNMSLANVIRERWDEAERWVPRLEDLAARGAVFSGALAAAVREEIAHGRGGPAPEHRALRDLGYPGFSQLLSYRPVRTSIS